METRRWVNQSQPDLMQIAVWILYFRAVMTLLFGLDDQMEIVFPAPDLQQVVVPLGLAAAGFGIANERKWGYGLGVAMAALPLVARVLLGLGISFRFDVPSISPLDYDIIGLLFEIALVALLVHPRSREYQRIWFK
jgi:hypothetical protein